MRPVFEEEGVVKFAADHLTRALDPDRYQEAATELSAWRELLYRLGVVGVDAARYGGAGFGNMSARLAPYSIDRGRRAFMITGTQTGSHRSVDLAHFSVVQSYNVKENRVASIGQAAPSSESLTHGAIYDINPSIRYVFHAHAPTIWTRAEALRIPISDSTVAYGTVAMAREVARLYRSTSLSDIRVFAMGGHEDGIIAFGKTPKETGLVLLDMLARAYALETEERRQR